MFQRITAGACFALLGLLLVQPTHATPFPSLSMDVGVCDPNNPQNCIKPDSSGNVPITGSITANLGGFLPSLSYGTLTATASSSASTALPTNTGTVAFQNQNTVAVSCTLAAGSATATTNEIIVPAGSTVFIATTGYDHAACINQTGSASNIIVMAGGSGLGTGFGGGSAGGGGGAVTVADGADVTQGALADAAPAAGGTGSVSAKLRLMTTQLNTGNTSLATIATNSGLPVPVNVNTVPTALTGLTPGVAQTGTVVAANVDSTSKGGVAYGAMANYGTSPGAVKVDGVNAFVTNTVTTTNGAADPCQGNVATIKSFSITTATTTNIVTGTSAKKLYVCYLYMQTAAANNVAVISGTTGATCGSNTAALVGGTTAANGLNNAANGGQAMGNGGFSVLQVQTNNDDICIITSASTPLAGVIKYVVQ